MKNFSIEHKGEIFWISRAVAVIGFVFKEIDNKWYILINQRGEGTPDFQLHWNIPCGYLDYDETHEEGTSRELYEETGFKVEPDKWKLIGIQSDPNANRQNVSLRSYYIAHEHEDFAGVQGGENNEVADIKWLEIGKLNTIDKWAFGHDKIINEVFSIIQEKA